MAEKAIADLGFKVISDEGRLAEIVRRAIAANPKAVALEPNRFIL